MKERPIIFSTEMVRAILDGRKTQTRRVVKKPIKYVQAGYYKNKVVSHYTYPIPIKTLIKHNYGFWYPLEVIAKECPFGIVGDRLWVKETFCLVNDTEFGGKKWIDYRATPKYESEHPAGWENDPHNPDALKWKSSRYMNRKYSRINLEITNIRVERVQDINNLDALAEGITCPKPRQYSQDSDIEYPDVEPTEIFQEFWNSINARRGYGWDKNPWVWVIEFKKFK